MSELPLELAKSLQEARILREEAWLLRAICRIERLKLAAIRQWWKMRHNRALEPSQQFPNATELSHLAATVTEPLPGRSISHREG